MPVTDAAGIGLSTLPIDPLRYNCSVVEPGEVVEVLLSLIPPNSRVLDIGCGTGSISSILKNRLSLDLVGIEPNPERAKAAGDYGFRVIAEELTPDLLGQLGQFDVVLFADVLEHMIDPASMLTMVSGSLSAGGRILASVPNVAHWSIRLKLLFGAFDYKPLGLMDATHLRWFTAASIRRLFETSGYVVRSQTVTAGTWQSVYCNHSPWKWISPGLRNNLVIGLARHLPTLFGCQHVLEAIPSN